MNTVIFGPPGTGKTTALLDRVAQELRNGTAPERIAFVSFTTAAVNEAVERAVSQFGVSKKQFHWFRTLHSMCFVTLGVNRDAMLTDYSHFAGNSGLRFSRSHGEQALSAGANDGDQFLSGHGLCAATGLPYAEVQHKYGLKLGQFRFGRVREQLESYKRQLKLIEYQDLLAMFLANCEPLPVDVAFIDEAQDLTPQQWRVALHAFKRADRLVIAGDDDQAIYEWCGAEPLRMLAMDGERIVLNRSYRLGTKHVELAKGITARIKHRQPKQWGAADPAKACEIHPWWSWADIDWSASAAWLVLARANQFLPALANMLERQGLAYNWCGSPRIKAQDARLFNAMKKLTDGESVPSSMALQLLEVSGNIRSISVKANAMISMRDPGMAGVRWLSQWPRQKLAYMERVCERYGAIENLHAQVELTTIHRAKGTEADNVVLCPDITPATWSNRSDAEHRVFYVAATRAKHHVFLLKPTHEHFYRV